MRPRKLLSATVALAFVLFSPLGWCPPPPNFGVFVPSGQTFNLGAVSIASSQNLTLTFLVAPASAGLAPYVIAQNFSVFFGISSPSFSIDSVGTTCVPGALVTTTTGCKVVITFAPSGSAGAQNATINVAAAPLSNPTSVSTVTSNSLIATAFVASAVPTLSESALVLLSILVLVLTGALFRRLSTTVGAARRST